MTRRGRPAFTMLEALIALTLLMAAASIVAELMTWSLAERQRAVARIAAVEFAGNLLEAARAEPFDRLTPEWAARQKPSAEVAALLPDLKLDVRVEPMPDRPGVKRVAVELRWEQSGAGAVPVRLAVYFAERRGGTP